MMKKLLFLLSALFVLTSMQAQFLSNWSLKRINAAAGQDRDLLERMDHEYFVGTAQDTPDWDYSNLNVDKRYVQSMVCENPHFRLGVNLQHRAMPRLELGFNLVGIFNRIDAMSFATPDSDWNDPNHQWLNIDLYTDELGLESTLSYRLEKSGFALIGSVGANAGYVYNGYLYISGGNLDYDENNLSFTDDGSSTNNEGTWVSESLTTRNGFSTRAFVGLNGSITLFHRVEIGGGFHYGIGQRFIHQSDPLRTTLHSFNFRAAWVLR